MYIFKEKAITQRERERERKRIENHINHKIINKYIYKSFLTNVNHQSLKFT